MDWLASHALAIGSALLAALAAAVGIVVRQAALHRSADDELTGAVMAAAVRDRLWWAGTAAATAGYAFQALALANGSLLLVQPLLVSALLFVLPLNAWRTHDRVTFPEWGWAILLTAGLDGVRPASVSRERDIRRTRCRAWAIALAGIVPIVVICVAAARRSAGRPRAMLLGVAVAVGLGLIAVVTKVCTHRFEVGGWQGLLTIPAPYVLVALAIVVTVMQQWAFRAGALEASVPVMLVGEPIVAVVLGAVVLGESLTVEGAGFLALPVAVAAMLAATIALGRSSGADSSRRRSRSRWPTVTRTREIPARVL